MRRLIRIATTNQAAREITGITAAIALLSFTVWMLLILESLHRH